MTKANFVNETPQSLDRPEDNEVFHDQEVGVAVVDIERIDEVYR